MERAGGALDVRILVVSLSARHATNWQQTAASSQPMSTNHHGGRNAAATCVRGLGIRLRKLAELDRLRRELGVLEKPSMPERETR